jgi:hypothetical protein
VLGKIPKAFVDWVLIFVPVYTLDDAVCGLMIIDCLEEALSHFINREYDA